MTSESVSIMKQIVGTSHHHYQRHPGYFYPVSPKQRIYAAMGLPLIIFIIIVIVARAYPVVQPVGGLPIGVLIAGLGASLLRLVIAYALALLFALPLALMINHNALTERLLLPVFDIMQSVPVLAFFPVVILFFVQQNFLEGAAVFIIFISMLWSLVFSFVGGWRQIPEDIKQASTIFEITGMAYVRKVLVPAMVPYFVTGSLVAIAGGWNILIVAEVLHTYLPNGSQDADLFGIGSIMVHASAAGQTTTFIGSIFVMTVAIALLNFFVWQRLLKYAERFHFE